ncbi:MAG TPA: hypothetical protein VJR89_00010 [Polyangiales bacterium]|nr:hypothetical protein [Polyangiales bacterium]
MTIAVAVCLSLVLLGADVASAADGGRVVPASVCAEPARVVELAPPGEALGGDAQPSDEGVLWCLSPDDPRCSPLEQGAGGSTLSQAKLGWATAGLAAPARVFESAADSCEVSYLGSARDGVLGRLERPPR